MLRKLSFAGCIVAGAGLVMADGPDRQDAALLDGVMTIGARQFVQPPSRGRDLETMEVLFDNGGVNYIGAKVIGDDISPAALLYDNGGEDYANGNEMTQWLQAEDFVLRQQSLVRRVEFGVLTFGGIGMWDGTGDWSIYADGGGMPGALVASGAGVKMTMTFDQNAGFDFYDGAMDLDVPQCLDPDKIYWMGLHLNSNGCASRDDMYFSTAFPNGTFPGNEDNGCVGTWFANGLEHSFLLTGDLDCGGGNEVCIDFDDDVEPCTFALTTALRAKYAGLGITFDGPGRLDGGGILDQCGGFGVLARSEPNFLAFNRSATFSDGGFATDPETINLDTPASAVSMWVSGGSGATSFQMDAYDGGGGFLGSGFADAPAGAYAELRVDFAGIRSVIITETRGDNAFVMDDLCVTFGGSADCLTLTVDPLVAGRRACWNVSGATPGEEVAIVYGFQEGTTVVNGLFGYCATFGIKGVNTNKLICRKNADGTGNVQCCKTIPARAGGTFVCSQAAERNTCPDECVSNKDCQVIQ